MFPRSITRTVAARNATALAAVAALVTGCSAGKINFVNVDSSYDASQYAHLPYTGPIFAEVTGNPFGMSQEDLEQLVNAYIQPPNARSPIGQGPRVHIAFGATAADRHSACQEGGAKGMVNGTITMVAALCRGGDAALTYLVGSVDDITGPNDPRFQSFLRQATVQLFPKTDEQMHDNNPFCMFPSC
ncbi:MAG TPA: hypothetical protein VMT54_19240 [Candidatus Cybelea sp.]|nr:hypothetical protein [Candidatus Cybelea sp.]